MISEQFEVRRPRRRFGCGARANQSSVPACLLTRLTLIVSWLLLLLAFDSSSDAQQPSREQWGGVPVSVSQHNGNWIITGRQRKVTLNPNNLALTIENRSTNWSTVASSDHDMEIRSGNEDFLTGLARAREKEFVPFDAGFKTGVKISLSDWSPHGTRVDLKLFLTVCLEGRDEDLVFDIAASEGQAKLRQLDWPGALDARDIDYTLLSNGRGTLLPRNWPKEYYPIRTITPDGKIASSDHSLLQSHVIESWSMSWWGFQKGKSAMMIIVETPDDAAYQFRHPAGGPTEIGPRWSSQLAQFSYPRSARMVFFDNGNYVDMAKRYRRYVMDTGLFVSLKEKIARTPAVAELIGTPQTRISILRNLSPDSDRYDTKDASKNYSLTTFDERAKQLGELKSRGFDRVLVFISGWPHLG